MDHVFNDRNITTLASCCMEELKLSSLVSAPCLPSSFVRLKALLPFSSGLSSPVLNRMASHDPFRLQLLVSKAQAQQQQRMDENKDEVGGAGD
jgi:hypothetical protein